MLRRTIDDAFASFDAVVLPTRRRTPRKIDAAIKREESDKPRNPELENTGQFNIYGIPAISVPCGFTSAGLPGGADDRRAAICRRAGVSVGERVRGGDIMAQPEAAASAGDAGAASGCNGRG